jgi:hypothetical protein
VKLDDFGKDATAINSGMPQQVLGKGTLHDKVLALAPQREND